MPLTVADFGTIGAGGPPDPAKDPYSAYRYLDAKRQNIIDSYHQRPLLRVWDQNHGYIGTLAQEKSVTCEELMADTGQASCVIRKDNWLSDFILYDRRAEQDLHLTIDPRPTVQDWPYRWGGKITTLTAKRDAQGLHTVEMQASSNREHLKHILALANPVLPPELQIPKMWIMPWNLRTGLTVSLWINLARQYFPLLAIPDNVLNPTAWLGTDPMDFNPLNWPIQPQYINPIFDQSRFEVFAARATDFHTSSQPLLEDAGCIWRGYTWLQTDPTSPHPELAGLDSFGQPLNTALGAGGIGGLLGGSGSGAFGSLGSLVEIGAELLTLPVTLIEDLLAGVIGGIAGVLPGGKQLTANNLLETLTRPGRNAVILAVEDKSGITGPTGTLADGPINLIANTADDLITDTIIPEYDPNGDGVTDPLIAQFFLVAPKPPWVVFPDSDLSPIIEASRTSHAPTAKTVMVGSRSPGWVNDLITFGIKYGLSVLSQVIDMGPLGAYQHPGSPGLDELYQGELDDTVFAYQRFSDPIRELLSGTHAYLESINKSAQTAWTIAGILGLREEQWKTRAFNSYKTTVRNGAPYCVGLDYALGDRVSFQVANVLFVDQVSGIKFSYDENEPVHWEIAVGTNATEIDPVSKAMRALASIWNIFGMFTGQSELF